MGQNRYCARRAGRGPPHTGVRFCRMESTPARLKSYPDIADNFSRTSQVRLAYVRHVANRLLQSPVGHSIPFCVHNVLTGLLSKPGSKHSTPTHPMGGGEHSSPWQFSVSNGLGNRNIGLIAMPPCLSSVARASSAAVGSLGSSKSRILTTGSPLTTLTR